jgi:hypothetical protein
VCFFPFSFFLFPSPPIYLATLSLISTASRDYAQLTITHSSQITIHRGPALLDDDSFSLDPTPPLQYKLEDGGAVYEVKGLGRFL